jgi:exodeoxyribonuclease III
MIAAMRIATLNCNGIRAAARKGLYDWLPRQDVDVLCLQETRCTDADLAPAEFRPRGWHGEWLHAARRGYSGVAVYARRRPDKVIRGFGSTEFDAEGRYLEVRFGQLSVVSLYLPSGSSGPERQAAKFRFLAEFMPYLERLRRSRRHFVLCGDWNIAHREIDLRNWRANQKNSGFLPEERAWLDDLFGRVRFVDAFRRVNSAAEQYTWWSNRGQAWAKNVGWRIDYQVVSPGFAARVERARIWKKSRFSDHAPLILDYDYAF